MSLELLIAGIVVALWVVAAAVVLVRRRPHREDRSIAAHQRALRALDVMRTRDIGPFIDLPPDEDLEEPQVWLIEDDHLPPPLPVTTPLLRERPLTTAGDALDPPSVRIPRPPSRPLTDPAPATEDPPVEQPAVQPLGEPVAQPHAEPVPEPLAEPVARPLAEPVAARAVASTPGPAVAVSSTVPTWAPPNRPPPPKIPGPLPGARPARLGAWSGRRLAACAAALVVVFAAVGTAIAGGGGSHRPRTTHEARASTATVPAPTSPPSTLPSAYPVTSGATGVQVKVPSGSVVTFTAVARCWLEATEGSGVVFAGILQPGATQSLTVRDVLSARVGNAQAVRITVGLRPAGLPDVGPNPLDIALTTHATT